MSGKSLYITGVSGGSGGHEGKVTTVKPGVGLLREPKLSGTCFGFCFPFIKCVRGENDLSVYVMEMTQCHF